MFFSSVKWDDCKKCLTTWSSEHDGDRSTSCVGHAQVYKLTDKKKLLKFVSHISALWAPMSDYKTKQQGKIYYDILAIFWRTLV